jgi:hypothetical protein
MKYILPTFLLILFGISHRTMAQSVVKKPISRYINVPNKSHVFPTLTADGMYMIFMSNYTSTGHFELVYSHKNGPESWEEAKHFELFYKKRLDFFGSHNVSYDGQHLVFASQRANGIGKFDIWFSKKQGNGWSNPINPGKPLNSMGNEGNPCLSPDNNTIYFMRCSSMDINEKSDCKIFMATRKRDDYWNDPIELPAYINEGNCVTPRIMIDNQTLVYASDKAGGKGKLDLYLTRYENGRWSKPVPYEFLNTEKNDEYISVPARGDVVYYHEKYKGQFNIFKALIPENLQPKDVRMLTGQISLPPGLTPDDLMMLAYDAENQEVISKATFNSKDNSYFINLAEGKVYDFSIFPKKPGYTYYAEMLDLSNLEKSEKTKTDIILERAGFGSEMVLRSIVFEPQSSQLSDLSEIEMRRLSRFMQNNRNATLEIGVYMDTVKMDSIPRPELTETTIDTLFQNIPVSALIENQADTDSLDIYAQKQAAKDSLLLAGFHFLQQDSVQWDMYKLNYTYHNDHTQKQADAIVEKLIKMGAPKENLIPVGYGDVYQKNYANMDRPYWVAVKIR